MLDFIFPSKLPRRDYFWRVLLFNLAAALLLTDIMTSELKLVPAISIMILYVYGIFFIFLPRMRDGHISRWLFLLLLIPYGDKALSILVLFKPTTMRWKQPEESSKIQTEQGAAANP